MKFLTQKEILSWNDRNFIVTSPFNLLGKLRFNYKSTWQRSNIINVIIAQDILDNPYINPHSTYTNEHTTVKIVTDVNIKYDFCFSVVKNHNEDFFNLLNKIFINELLFEYSIDDNNTKKLNFNKSVLSSIKEINYNISNREFTRYQYTFDGDLFSIIAYISYLEEAIDCFNLLYGYDEDGNEINLLKFPIGTVVTKDNDTDIDYLVIDYIFHKKGDDFFINYITTEILYSNKPIIKYGKINEFNEKDLNISRNGRIDKILN